MKHFLAYTTWRLLLLVATGGLAYAVGLRGFPLLLAAFLVSGLISFVVLRRQREEFGTDVGGFFRRINDRIDAAARAEDEPLPGADVPSAADGPTTQPAAHGAEPRD